MPLTQEARGIPADLTPATRTDVLVVGGGITGCAAAYYLALAGATVALVERFDINTQASGVNAGSLHAQIQHDPFVLLGEGWARAYAPTVRLLVDAIALWQRLSQELRVDLEVATPGGILVAETDAQMRDIERKAVIEREQGLPVELLSSDDLRRVAPYVSQRMVGGLFCPVEGKASSLLAAPALALAAKTQGARLLVRTEVLGIDRVNDGFRVETTAGRILCRRIVNCAGVDAGRVAEAVGVEVPIESHPFQVSVTEPVAPLVKHLVYFAGERLTVKQARIGSLLIGGGWPARVDGTSARPRVSPESLRANLRLAQKVVPSVAQANLLRTWVGVCNGVADHKPIIGEMVPDVYIATFPFLGFTAGPLMGSLIADVVLNRKPAHDLGPFSPARFV
jgi:sarcosine oxidase subunit beta